MNSRANETQVGGTHYQSTYQHWDMCADAFGDAHCKSAITKYLVRWRAKGGLQDLDKARHYLTKLIELLDENRVALSAPANTQAITVFIISNNLPEREATITKVVMGASGLADLLYVRVALDKLIVEAVLELSNDEKAVIPAPPGA